MSCLDFFSAFTSSVHDHVVVHLGSNLTNLEATPAAVIRPHSSASKAVFVPQAGVVNLACLSVPMDAALADVVVRVRVVVHLLFIAEFVNDLHVVGGGVVVAGVVHVRHFALLVAIIGVDGHVTAEGLHIANEKLGLTSILCPHCHLVFVVPPVALVLTGVGHAVFRVLHDHHHVDEGTVLKVL